MLQRQKTFKNGEVEDSKRKTSIFGGLLRQKTIKTTESNDRFQMNKTTCENTESSDKSRYQTVIEKYFTYFIKGIIEKEKNLEEIQEISSAETVSRNNTKLDFTLEDMKFLKETIMKEKSILENEIMEITFQKASNVRMSFKDKYNKKWGKIRSTALAMGKMQNLKNMVKEYGTSVNLVGFSYDKLDQLEQLMRRHEPEKNQFKSLLLYPQSKFLIYFWSPLLLFIMIYISFIVPYNITFFVQPSNMEIFVNSLFFVDIVINLVTVYEKDSVIIDNHIKIAIKFFKSWFIIDVLSLLPFEYIGCGTDCGYPGSQQDDIDDLLMFIMIPVTFKFFTLIRILQILKANHVKVFLNNLRDFLKLKTTTFHLLAFLLQVTICVHITGCLWLYIAKVRLYAPNTWVTSGGYNNDDDFSLYIEGLYWAVSTICTVGYGDIHANNEVEYLISIIWMFFGAGFYSYTVGSLSNLLVSMDGRRGKLRRKIMQMEGFNKEHHFKVALKRKVNMALTYNSVRTIFNQSEKNEFLSELPSELKYELANSMYMNLNSKLIFFKQKDKTFLAEFMPLLSPLKFMKGEYIYHSNESPLFVYFIVKGRVNFVTGKYHTCFKTIVDGSYFGEIEIYDNTSRQFNLQACSECHLLVIRREDFEKIMSIFPDYDSQFKEIAKKKLVKINESLEKIKDLQTIKLSSEFWSHKKKNIYQLAKEEKESQHGKLKSKFSQIKFNSNENIINNENLTINENLYNNENKENENTIISSSKRNLLTKQSSIISLIGMDSFTTPKNLGEINNPNTFSDAQINLQETNLSPNLNTDNLKIPNSSEKFRRKSQFFYGLANNLKIKTQEKVLNSPENDKSEEIGKLKEKLESSEKIVKESENEIRNIMDSIDRMKNFLMECAKKKKEKKTLFNNFL